MSFLLPIYTLRQWDAVFYDGWLFDYKNSLLVALLVHSLFTALSHVALYFCHNWSGSCCLLWRAHNNYFMVTRHHRRALSFRTEYGFGCHEISAGKLWGLNYRDALYAQEWRKSFTYQASAFLCSMYPCLMFEESSNYLLCNLNQWIKFHLR